MSRSLNGSSDYLNNATAIVSVTPLTLAAWFKSDSSTVSQALMTIGTVGTTNNRLSLMVRGDVAGDPVQVLVETTSPSSANSTTGYTAGTWHHACAVFTSSTSRSIFIDGGSKATNTTNKTPSGMDVSRIGASPAGTAFFDGVIAEAAIWNVALTDIDVAIVALGVSPLMIRPESLLAYWPLIGRFSPEIDRVGGFSLTLEGAGAAYADHARIIYPNIQTSMKWTSGAAPPTGHPAIRRFGTSQFAGVHAIGSKGIRVF